MNIALSTLLLFFILIPGIVFRRFYYSEEFSREYFRETLFGVFIATLLPSVLFHFLWFYLVKLCGHEVDFFIIGNIISSNPSRSSFENIHDNATKIVFYNLSLFFTAGFLGYSSKKLVRHMKWDRKYKFFRFQNAWHYILKGEFFDFPRSDYFLENDTVEDIEFVFIDAVIEIHENSYLYDGILVDYELSKNGGLETISIKNTQRRKLNDDRRISDDNEENAEVNYYPIAGHLLILKYSEIKNLNFTYYTLDSVNEKYQLRMVK